MEVEAARAAGAEAAEAEAAEAARAAEAVRAAGAEEAGAEGREGGLDPVASPHPWIHAVLSRKKATVFAPAHLIGLWWTRWTSTSAARRHRATESAASAD